MKKITLLLVAFFCLSLTGMCQEPNFQMIYVKGGQFFMGGDDQRYRGEDYANERPVHRISISGFYIGKYEVTQSQWRAIMGINPPAYTGSRYGNKDCDNCPVVKVTWEDVQEFIRRMNMKYPGKRYRMPTEAEWEYASRGGKYSKNYKYSGGDKLSEVGWYGHRNGTTSPVGKKLPNELSIYDMSGNVLEWCSDWFGDEYYKGAVDMIDPKGPDNGELKVLRGGSYSEDADVCRNVHRTRMIPSTSHWDIGFRLAMDIDSAAIQRKVVE
jgi:sulfatase modifying factor 1